MTKYTIKKEKDFVQIPNSILTSPDISLKAKGILALMLSLPDNWKFSIEGIASKCKESRECISNAIKELESAGYVKRSMKHGDDGKITGMEYEIFEEPYTVTEAEEHNEEKPCEDKPCTANPSAEKPCTEEPSEEKPLTDKPSEENPWVNNTKTNKKENNNILYNNTQSNPIPSKNKMSELDIYRKAVKQNIEYDILVEKEPLHKDMIDEIVELMAETLNSKREEITIASDTHSMDDVRERFTDITSEHIEYIIECVSKNTTKVSNIKQYMLAAIFNAPNTMGSYYTTRVNYDWHR
ncbi:MAG: helix-turn-helix domain-containing protein [Clostridia bacterium]|nr:helix-turn-helix domain-containing protein [Clostridia bacterium]